MSDEPSLADRLADGTVLEGEGGRLAVKIDGSWYAGGGVTCVPDVHCAVVYSPAEPRRPEPQRPDGVPEWARVDPVWRWLDDAGFEQVIWHTDVPAKDLPRPPDPEPLYSITLGPHTWEKASNGDWIDPAREGLDAHHTSTLGIALARIEELCDPEVGRAPEPTLVEQARTRARRLRAELLDHDATLLDALADELENRHD